MEDRFVRDTQLCSSLPTTQPMPLRVLCAVFNLSVDIDSLKHHGLTDPLILVLMLEQHGVAKQEAMDKLPAMKAEMTRYFAAHAADAGTGLEILPGVRELLHALQV